jgi:hypothetical protein
MAEAAEISFSSSPIPQPFIQPSGGHPWFIHGEIPPQFPQEMLQPPDHADRHGEPEADPDPRAHRRFPIARESRSTVRRHVSARSSSRLTT